jgi:hypothetical protein
LTDGFQEVCNSRKVVLPVVGIVTLILVHISCGLF